MSFTNTPITRALVFGLVLSSIAASLLDVKHYFYILVDPHIWRYGQWWRILIYQLCYTNSSEALFAGMTLYQMRVVERMWGSRKYASFIAVASLFTALVPPLLTIALRPLTAGFVNYLPAGPTPIVFAVLAQYHAVVPHVYKYRVASSPAPPAAGGGGGGGGESTGWTLSDKSYRYALALQLAMLQMPGSALGAAVGWIVGCAWRYDVMPGALTRWRLPGWVVGLRSQKTREGFEGLRRRLEGEGSGAAVASGVQGQPAGDHGRRRGALGQQILDQFRAGL